MRCINWTSQPSLGPQWFTLVAMDLWRASKGLKGPMSFSLMGHSLMCAFTTTCSWLSKAWKVWHDVRLPRLPSVFEGSSWNMFNLLCNLHVAFRHIQNRFATLQHCTCQFWIVHFCVPARTDLEFNSHPSKLQRWRRSSHLLEAWWICLDLGPPSASYDKPAWVLIVPDVEPRPFLCLGDIVLGAPSHFNSACDAHCFGQNEVPLQGPTCVMFKQPCCESDQENENGKDSGTDGWL